jgi:hypothetical protein
VKMLAFTAERTAVMTTRFMIVAAAGIPIWVNTCTKGLPPKDVAKSGVLLCGCAKGPRVPGIHPLRASS